MVRYASHGAARKVLAKLREDGLRPDVKFLSMFSESCEDPEEVQDAFAEFERADVRPNVYTLACVIAKCSEPEEAQEWIDRLAAYGVEPNAEAYTNLLAVYSKVAGKMNDAKQLFERIRSDGLATTEKAWSIMIRASTREARNIYMRVGWGGL
eukprot:gene58246-biopygen94393